MQKSDYFMIARNDSVVASILSLASEHKRALDLMRKPMHKASGLPVSRRVLSHWRNWKLMDIYGDNPDQKKLSYIGLFWLLTALELRNFGLSLDKISHIQNKFFGDKRYPLFETYVFLSDVWKHIDFFLIVTADGRAEVASRQEIDMSESLGLLNHHFIRLNFAVIKRRIKPNHEEIVKQKFFNSFVSSSEQSILELIKSGQYKEITLKFNDGVITRIAKKALLGCSDPVAEVRKAISSHDGFADISIKKVNGKIVSMETTVMQKV